MTAHPAVSLSSEEPLVDGIVRWWQARIDDRIVRPGTRLPSIRGFAADKRVSRHTVVEAYERLAELGYVEAVRRVTREAMRDAVRRHLHPDRFTGAAIGGSQGGAE